MAGTVLTSAQFAAFFKTRYPAAKMKSLVEFDKPTLQAFAKSGDKLDGAVTNIPVELDSPQGHSAHLGAARTNASSSVGRQWALTTASHYGALTIDARTMMAAQKDVGAFFRTREHEVDRILGGIGQYNEMSLWRDGTGSTGIINGDPGTGTTIQLATISDAFNFNEQEDITFHDDVAGAPSTVRAGGSRRITGVNYATGVLTVDAAMDAAVEDTDHIVREGCLDGVFQGIPSWITAADPTDTLFGVARTLYPQKLGGHRQAWLGSIEETAKKLDSTIRRANQRSKVLWLSYANFNRLDLELGARGYRSEDGGKGVFGRMSLGMSTPNGGVEVKAAPYLNDTTGYLLDMSTWELLHLGGFPHIVQDDGLTATRLAPAAVVTGDANEGDGIEIRFRQFAQTYCSNPFSNGRFPIV